jgi:muramoyltetrapeptide carboxypeptidase
MIKKPKALQKGHTIAIVSPAAPSTEADLTQGIAWLESCGYHVKLMAHAHLHEGYMAGTDEQRLADLIEAIEDPTIDAILCARGGYGSGRLLPFLPWQRWKSENLACKLVMGFSDITMLHTAFFQELGWVSYYSPMLTSNLVHESGVFTRGQWRRFLDASTFTELPVELPNQDAYHCLNAGVAEGISRGGNLSLLAALCGTPWQPHFKDAVVVIEDWKERYYTLDRQFTQLLQAGVFNGAKGLLFADFSQIEEDPIRPLGKQLAWLCQDLELPMGYGFSIGHGAQTATLPLGVKIRFDARAGHVTLLESPFRFH